MDEVTKQGFLTSLQKVSAEDVEGIMVGEEEYNRSWMARGGQGVFFTLVRCLDRIPVLCARKPKDGDRYDIFAHCIESDGTGILDSIRDARRYFLMLESELVRQGYDLPKQRHNVKAEAARKQDNKKQEQTLEQVRTLMIKEKH